MKSDQTLHGFDPLSSLEEEGTTTAIFEEANRRIVLNVLKSYTGYFDVFNELIQNALDAVEKRAAVEDDGYQPKVWITVDLQNRHVKVVDNGVGMTLEEFKYFVRPNISFKKQRETRGHKGVGATFLAYGFSAVRIQTKQEGSQWSVAMRQGRQWAEDRTNSVPRPSFEEIEPFAEEIVPESSGTAVEVVLGNEPGVRPRDLGWLGAQNASSWTDVLRLKTPVGGVYLVTSAFSPTIEVKVIDVHGVITREDLKKPEYYYPHEFPGFKSQDVSSLEQALASIQGSTDERFAKLDSEFKRLNCLYEIYDKDDLLEEASPFASALNEEDRQLIEKHQVSVYASFLSSAKLWGAFNDDTLKLRKGQRIVHGGLQMASDNMVQGDLSVIPLTSEIGYQANSHVIVHMVDGNPDMGRKIFQPELQSLGTKLAVRCVNILKKYRQNLKPDTGSTRVAPDKELHEYKKNQEQYRDEKPLSISWTDGKAYISAIPQQEQDVIALFHQMIGGKLLRGYEFYATSQSERYDSLFQLNYSDDDKVKFERDSNPLGVGVDFHPPYSSHPKVLEYKYDLDALVRDIDKEIKYAKHIDLVVCWTAEKQFKERYYLNSLLVSDEGASRENFGATHQAFPTGSNQPDFEVVVLEDLINFLKDPDAEKARQKQKYDA
ncbi:ATP-binding protein [Ruegeria arenilitoris]|uniref:ATP-binding protein n=1 Tax=Ruegeria arenilitoris TaxID=1173585 RepID=UPI00147C1A64|nr:ATP-binding protein [Ruegeria arenilitoris]